MSGPIAHGRRYDEKEVARILERATELQHRTPIDPTETTGMTLAELEQVAREAGIDPQHVRDAAAALDRDVPAAGGLALLGAPLRAELERTVDGEVASSAYEALGSVIRETLATQGFAANVGAGLEWQSGNPQRPVRVTVTPRAGRTVIRIEERFGGLAGGLFGGIVGGAGGGGGGAVIGVIGGAFGALGPALAVASLIVLGSFLLARAIFRAVVRRRLRQLHRLLDALTAHLAGR
jgi:hypothetical protein